MLEIDFGRLQLLGTGGCKSVYALDETQAIAILSPELDLDLRERMVKEEIERADELRKLGLMCLDYVATKIKLVPPRSQFPETFVTLTMTSFEHLQKQGIQIRDGKNGHQHEETEMFDWSDAAAKALFKQAFSGIIDDITILLSHGIPLAPDSFNIALIQRPSDSLSPSSSHQIATLTKLRLFFFDFSSKSNELNHERYRFIDASGEPIVEHIREIAENYLAISFHIMTIECKNKVNKINDDFRKELFNELCENITKKVVDEINSMSPDKKQQLFPKANKNHYSIQLKKLTNYSSLSPFIPEISEGIKNLLQSKVTITESLLALLVKHKDQSGDITLGLIKMKNAGIVIADDIISMLTIHVSYIRQIGDQLLSWKFQYREHMTLDDFVYALSLHVPKEVNTPPEDPSTASLSSSSSSSSNPETELTSTVLLSPAPTSTFFSSSSSENQTQGHGSPKPAR